MEAEKPPMLANIPQTKKHFTTMVHNINPDKLRTMLREKCRIRFRDARHNRFDGSRNIQESDKKWLVDAMREDLTEFDLDLLLEDAMLKEILEEELKWLAEQYERYELAMDAEIPNDPEKALLVMCPICQVQELKFSDQMLHCTCGFEFVYQGSLQGFWKHIQMAVTAHEEKCVAKLSFFKDPNESNFNLMCSSCDFLAVVS